MRSVAEPLMADPTTLATVVACERSWHADEGLLHGFNHTPCIQSSHATVCMQTHIGPMLVPIDVVQNPRPVAPLTVLPSALHTRWIVPVAILCVCVCGGG